MITQTLCLSNQSLKATEIQYPVGVQPIGITYDPNNKDIYIANFGSDTVSVMNSSSYHVNATVLAGSHPTGIAYNPSNKDIYVVNSGSNDISIIPEHKNSVVGTVKVGNTPIAIAYNPSNKGMYVANSGSNTVSVINGTTNIVVAKVIVGSHPQGIAYNPTNGGMYVVNAESDDISIINRLTNTLVGTISVGNTPIAIAYNPSNKGMYVANSGSNTVSVINGTTNTLVNTIKVGIEPTAVAVNANQQWNIVYVTNGVSNTVSVVDGRRDKVVDNVMVGMSPAGVAVSSAKPYNVYVTNIDNNTVSVLDNKPNGTELAAYRVIFTVKPYNAGNINCNGKNISNNDYVMYRMGTVLNCRANPFSNYTFDSWSGSISPTLPSIAKKISWPNYFLYDVLLGYGPSHGVINSIKIAVFKNGELSATFISNVTSAAHLILGIIIFLTIILIGVWLFRRHRRPLSENKKRIERIYDRYRVHHNEKDACLTRLQEMTDELKKLREDGRISGSYFNHLDKKISQVTEEIQREKDIFPK